MGILTGAGRVGRLHYFGVAVATTVVTWIGVYASIDVDELTGEVHLSPLIIVVVVASVWFSATNVLRRLHDCGHSGWMLLLSLVPIIGTLLWIYLLFVPGDPVRNLYGPPPGSAPPPSRDAHRQRMELLTAAAEQAYRARSTGSLLNEDGTYNMDWMSGDQGGRTDPTPNPGPPTTPVRWSDGDVAAPAMDVRLATLPPPPVAPEPVLGWGSPPATDPGVAGFPPPAIPARRSGPPPVETELSTLRHPAGAEPAPPPPGGDGTLGDRHGPARS